MFFSGILVGASIVIFFVAMFASQTDDDYYDYDNHYN